MFVITAMKDRRRWVSGIFRSRSQVDAYLAELPREKRSLHRIGIVDLDFPFCIITYARGFRCVTKAQAEAEINGSASRDGWLTVYAIDTEYRPAVPGSNEMGSLPLRRRDRIAGHG